MRSWPRRPGDRATSTPTAPVAPQSSRTRRSPARTRSRPSSGAVASKGTANACAVAFPAWSRQLARTGAAGPSGPPRVSGSQPARPDVASVALTAKPTGRVYHPPWSGERAALTSRTTGGVASKRSAKRPGALVLPARSRQRPGHAGGGAVGPGVRRRRAALEPGRRVRARERHGQRVSGTSRSRPALATRWRRSAAAACGPPDRDRARGLVPAVGSCGAAALGSGRVPADRLVGAAGHAHERRFERPGQLHVADVPVPAARGLLGREAADGDLRLARRRRCRRPISRARLATSAARVTATTAFASGPEDRGWRSPARVRIRPASRSCVSVGSPRDRRHGQRDDRCRRGRQRRGGALAGAGRVQAGGMPAALGGGAAAPVGRAPAAARGRDGRPRMPGRTRRSGPRSCRASARSGAQPPRRGRRASGQPPVAARRRPAAWKGRGRRTARGRRRCSRRLRCLGLRAGRPGAGDVPGGAASGCCACAELGSTTRTSMTARKAAPAFARPPSGLPGQVLTVASRVGEFDAR